MRNSYHLILALVILFAPGLCNTGCATTKQRTVLQDAPTWWYAGGTHDAAQRGTQ